MIKKQLSIFCVLLALGWASAAKSAPVYYTFEGNVTAVFDDAGIIADAGLGIGSAITYTFIVDFDASGTARYNDGYTGTYVDDASHDYFYADYISGSALSEKNGGFYNDPIWDIAEYNYGEHEKTLNQSVLVGNSQDDTIQIYNAPGAGDPFGWDVGTQLYAKNVLFDSTGVSSRLYGRVTVTDVAPVPVPPSLLLLGTGLIGLVGFRRKFRN